MLYIIMHVQSAIAFLSIIKKNEFQCVLQVQSVRGRWVYFILHMCRFLIGCVASQDTLI